MSSLEALNRSLFLSLNAAADTAPFVISVAKFMASGLVLYVPILLVFLWLWGDDRQRNTVLRAFATMAAAFCLSFIVGHAWHHPRPLALQLGNTFIFHVLDASFPSDHTTGVASVGFALLLCGVTRPAWITLAIGLLVGWSRIFLGIHFPFDIIGAFIISYAVAQAMGPLWGRIGIRLTQSANKIYRTLLAPVIARGWIPK